MTRAVRSEASLKGTTSVLIILEGRAVRAVEGETLVSALLTAGVEGFQSNPKSGSARGPFCLMGVCQDCRVLVDGQMTLGCLTLVKPGLVVDLIPTPRRGHL